jgi:hypothetical protein
MVKVMCGLPWCIPQKFCDRRQQKSANFSTNKFIVSALSAKRCKKADKAIIGN